MNKKIRFITALCILVSLLCVVFLSGCGGGQDIDGDQDGFDGEETETVVNLLYEKNYERALVLTDAYYKNFVRNRLLYLNALSGTATCWEYIGLLSLNYKLAVLDSSYLQNMDEIIEGLLHYRREKDGKFNGYAVTRAFVQNKANGGVAYDDNMWLLRDFAALYDLTGEEKYLEYAVEIGDYLIENAFVELSPSILADIGYELGENDEVGGFYWDERHSSLHVCSNGPAIQNMAALYRLTGDDKYLNYAIKAYNFVLSLQMENGVFYDLMRFFKDENNNILAVKEKAGPPYAYNSGSPITGAIELYRVTNDEKYLLKAKEMAKAADEYFLIDSPIEGVKQYESDNIWFLLILLNGYSALLPYADDTMIYIENIQNAIDYAYENHLSVSSGIYYNNLLPNDLFNGWQDKPFSSAWSLNISSHAEIYATLAAIVS